MSNSPVLVVQPSDSLTTQIRDALQAKSLFSYPADSVETGLQYLQGHTLDIAVLDVHMENDMGYQLLRHISANYKNIESIVVTKTPTVQGAVQAMRQGAFSYLPSVQVPVVFPQLIKKVLFLVRHRNMNYTTMHFDQPSHLEMIGKSHSFLTVIDQAKQAAKSNENILISGESGTGKDLLARYIHYQSELSNGPFIPVNCAAIPNDLMESEMFGHVEGAYTGAKQTCDGFFQAADGGTIFLDEISETTPPMQAKLLRVLEDQEIWKVGNRQPDIINVQIIAATNKDLNALVGEQQFREDLYYRMNIIPVRIPSLKDRKEDILLLSQYFAKKYAQKQHREVPQFSQEVVDAFQRYNWPGNVRQLENIIKRLVVFVQDKVIRMSDLPEYMRFKMKNSDFGTNTLAEVEKTHIQNVCEQVNWNLSEAARVLDIYRCTLYNKLRKYDIQTDASHHIS